MNYKKTSYFFVLFGILSALNIQLSLSAVATETKPAFRGMYVANIGAAKANPSAPPKERVRGSMQIGTRGNVAIPPPKKQFFDKKPLDPRLENQQKNRISLGKHRQSTESSSSISNSEIEMKEKQDFMQDSEWLDSKKTAKMRAQNAGNYMASHIGRGAGTSLGAPKIGQDIASALSVNLQKKPGLLDSHKKEYEKKQFRKEHENLKQVDRENIRQHAADIASEYGGTAGGLAGSMAGRAAAVPVVAAIAGATSGIGAVAAPIVSTGLAVAGSTAGHIAGGLSGKAAGKIAANSAIKLHQKGFSHAQQGADTMEARVTGKPVYRDANGDIIPYPDSEENKQRDRQRGTLKVKAARAIGKRIGGATEMIVKAPFNVQKQDELAKKERERRRQQDDWDKEHHGGLDLRTRAQIAKESRKLHRERD